MNDDDRIIIASRNVSPITVRIVAVFTALLGVMIAALAPTAGALVFAAGALLALSAGR